MRKLITGLILIAFLLNSLLPSPALAQVSLLPQAGTLVGTTPEFKPAQLVAMEIDVKNPLLFDFYFHKAPTVQTPEDEKEEYAKIARYFLAALTIPDENQWVNLSPYEGNRIIDNEFGMTEMGRDLLAQDYILKQLTASLTHPDTALGKTFWTSVYAKAHEKLGTTNIPLNTFNKVWIMPDEAVVYEKGGAAFILQSHLKVLTERDYRSLRKNLDNVQLGTDVQTEEEVEELAAISDQAVRDILLPVIEKEVNEGQNFANLRQIYSAMIMATWYKRALKSTLLGHVYVDQAKVAGVEQDPKNNEEIYLQYIAAFRKGVFNLIREDADAFTSEVIPRKYFSGGFERNAQSVRYVGEDAAQAYSVPITPPADLAKAKINLLPATRRASVGKLGAADHAMLDDVLGNDDKRTFHTKVLLPLITSLLDVNPDLVVDAPTGIPVEEQAKAVNKALARAVENIDLPRHALLGHFTVNEASSLLPADVAKATEDLRRYVRVSKKQASAEAQAVYELRLDRSLIENFPVIPNITRAEWIAVWKQYRQKLHSPTITKAAIDNWIALDTQFPTAADEIRQMLKEVVFKENVARPEAQQEYLAAVPMLLLEPATSRKAPDRAWVKEAVVTPLKEIGLSPEQWQNIWDRYQNNLSLEEKTEWLSQLPNKVADVAYFDSHATDVIRDALESLTRPQRSTTEWMPATQERLHRYVREELDQAMLPSAAKDKLGGIDLNADQLKLLIQRDENGMPLPGSQQTWEKINVQGFFPSIISIEPVRHLPVLGDARTSALPSAV